MLGGETPGTSSARSRKLRPFIGRFATSAWVIVPAIWLRAVSITVACAVTDTVVARDSTLSAIDRSKAEPSVSVTGLDVRRGQTSKLRRILGALRSTSCDKVSQGAGFGALSPSSLHVRNTNVT